MQKKYWRMFPLVSIEGRQVSVSVDVTNTGGQRGVYRFVLSLDGQPAKEQYVALDPLETQTLTFTVSGLSDGQHSLQIGNLSHEFQSAFFIRWWLLIVLVVVVAFLLWLLYRFAFK